MVSSGCVVFVFVTKPATWFRRRPLQMIGQRSNNVRNLRKLSRRPILYENLVSIPLEALARLRFYALLIFLQCVHYMSELFQEEEKVREATEEGERVSARFGADLRSRWNVERWDLDSEHVLTRIRWIKGKPEENTLPNAIAFLQWYL